MYVFPLLFKKMCNLLNYMVFSIKFIYIKFGVTPDDQILFTLSVFLFLISFPLPSPLKYIQFIQLNAKTQQSTN